MDVLLVEDDPNMSELFQLILKQRGHTVTVFYDGESGWAHYQTHHYPMVILDWVLPGISGLEVCQRIRGSSKGACSLVLMITSRTNLGDLEQVLAAGADDYLPKPIELATLNIRLSIAEHGVIKQQEKRAAEIQLRTAAVAFETHEGIIITDASAVILRVNRAFTEITGYGPGDILGKKPSVLQSGRHDRPYYIEMWQDLRHTGAWSGEIWDKRKDGEIYPSWLTITSVKDEQQEVVNYVAIFSDITERKRTELEIQKMAFYDALTSLPNRRLFLDRFASALNASARHKDYGAVLFLDMDKFKSLNDTLGHDYGDLLLIEVGVRIKSCLRELDTVARYGGNEFVVLIESVSEDVDVAIQKIALVAEKIRVALARTYTLKEYEYDSSPSIGVSLYHGNDELMDALLGQADMAMYEVKKAGRNAVRFFDPLMQKNTLKRNALVQDLQQAIALNQLQLYYQLQVDKDNQPLGAEAFLRWMHPMHGLLMPSQFIQIAEESTLIIDIDNWVLQTVCAQLVLWQRNVKMRNLTLTVNVSDRNFAQDNFVSHVADVLKAHHVDPARIKLELSERLALTDMSNSMEKIHELKKLGIRLSMDNFSTVFSSLSYLSQISSGQLKIKHEFVQGVTSKGNDARLVQAIVDLAKSLEMNVSAEGVETEEQLAFFKNKNCNVYQGFLFGRPVSIDEFDALLS